MQVQVLVPTGVNVSFTYEAEKSVAVGEIVIVPFRSKSTLGVIWSDKSADFKGTAKTIEATTGFILPEAMMKFVNWVSDYTMTQKGLILRMVWDKATSLAFRYSDGSETRNLAAPYKRDMAVVRAQLSNIPIVLASATPSLETIVNVQKGRYQFLHLADRFAGAELPNVSIVDMRLQSKGVWLAEPLLKTGLRTFNFVPCMWSSFYVPRMCRLMIEKIESGQIDIIIGTQMLAKGHHFPMLTLVGALDADLGLNGGDLRSGERTYQLLHQVSGRAGREERGGEVMLQTYHPDHPIMQALKDHDRERFYVCETEERQLHEMPPFARLAAVILSGLNADQCLGLYRRHLHVFVGDIVGGFWSKPIVLYVCSHFYKIGFKKRPFLKRFVSQSISIHKVLCSEYLLLTIS
eukprot:gene17412-17603_t